MRWSPRPLSRLCPVLLALTLVGLATTGHPAAAATPAAAAPRRVKAAAGQSDPDRIEGNVARLIGAALLADDAYGKLEWLCDDIGHRLSGSPELDRAIAWAQAEMKADGLVNVHAEPVMVPHWERGAEQAWIEAPTHRELHMLGLGGSVGTPAGGLTAEVAVVTSMSGLDSLGAAGVTGRIVLFDVPFESYGQTVLYRSAGASRAARLGAVATFVRSVTPVSLDTPHTGALRYADDAPKVPAAALTIESASLIHRLVARGIPVRVHLEMGARTLEDAPSANVIGEVPGSTHPEEIVVLGGHLDSWDVGQGAQDDGVGVVLCMEAAHLIQRLGLTPRRTIRVVLWTNEENGLRGARAYKEAHRAEWGRHVAAIESDIGNGLAKGFEVDLRPRLGTPADSTRRAVIDSLEAAARAAGLARAQALARFFAPMGSGTLEPGGGGADVGPLAEEGVAALGVSHDASRYFDIHHTAADTFDKVSRHDMATNVATIAVMTYLMADLPDRLLPPPAVGAPAPGSGH